MAQSNNTSSAKGSANNMVNELECGLFRGSLKSSTASFGAAKRHVTDLLNALVSVYSVRDALTEDAKKSEATRNFIKACCPTFSDGSGLSIYDFPHVVYTAPDGKKSRRVVRFRCMTEEAYTKKLERSKNGLSSSVLCVVRFTFKAVTSVVFVEMASASVATQIFCRDALCDCRAVARALGVSVNVPRLVANKMTDEEKASLSGCSVTYDWKCEHDDLEIGCFVPKK